MTCRKTIPSPEDLTRAERQDDIDIRSMVTDTLVIRVVFQQRKGGCNAEESFSPIEKLKRLGLYLEGSHPPTPSSFIRLASRFFSETPLRTSNPPSTSC